MTVSSAFACPVCDNIVTIDAARANCFMSEVEQLKQSTKEPIVVNFVACSKEVTRKGVVDTLGPMPAGDPVASDLDDVAFLSKASLDCLVQAIPTTPLPSAITLDCAP